MACVFVHREYSQSNDDIVYLCSVFCPSFNALLLKSPTKRILFYKNRERERETLYNHQAERRLQPSANLPITQFILDLNLFASLIRFNIYVCSMQWNLSTTLALLSCHSRATHSCVGGCFSHPCVCRRHRHKLRVVMLSRAHSWMNKKINKRMKKPRTTNLNIKYSFYGVDVILKPRLLTLSLAFITAALQHRYDEKVTLR